MKRPLRLFVMLWAFCAFCSAQAPATETFIISLKTMGKALAGCREAYTRTYDREPLLRSVVGVDNYSKDMTSLSHAETFVNALIAHPERMSGKALVAILSTSDDFSIGVGSTRTEVLRHLVIDTPNAHRAQELMLSAESLNDCQKSLFNAGDDYVGLVMDYVGAEDNALAAKIKNR